MKKSNDWKSVYLGKFKIVLTIADIPYFADVRILWLIPIPTPNSPQ